MMPLPSPELILFSTAMGLIAIGLAGLALSRHLFRTVLALVISEAGANLMLVLAGYRWDSVAPIMTHLGAQPGMVDPVPQAMVLTAIVIGVGVQALAISILIRIRQLYGTLERSEVAERMQADIAAAAGTPRDISQEAPLGERPLPPLPSLSQADGAEAQGGKS